jgi:phosphoribosylaminoimidazolecarboxamide formyltransferase/IMP cyclohydrolase
MVVVNLYEFEKVAANPNADIAELIENIDIGGPTMIRSAAKNYRDVAIVVSPSDYPAIVQELQDGGGSLSPETHWRLARKAFRATADYDRAISARLARIDDAAALPPALDLRADKLIDLRYGENPHQSAEQSSLAESYRKAFECDPVSAYGGVLAFNRPVDEETAREVSKTFIEAIAAPDYTSEALAVLSAKKNLRLMKVACGDDGLVVKSIGGGFLAQTADMHRLTRQETQVKTKRAPTEEEWTGIEFAWKIAKHVKSNAIVYARAGQTVGVGAGQMSRVDSVRIGAAKAVLPLAGTVVGSDAFFPFPDGVEEAAKHGVTAIIQPGGSVRDEEVIAAADRLHLAMVFTGVRHFRH